MRRFRLLAALLAAALALAACGGGSKGGQVSGGAKQQLVVWANGAEGDKLQVLADAFTKQDPNVTVSVRRQD